MVIYIAPNCPRRIQYTVILRLLADDPQPLHNRPDLLSQDHLFHPALTLALTAWLWKTQVSNRIQKDLLSYLEIPFLPGVNTSVPEITVCLANAHRSNKTRHLVQNVVQRLGERAGVIATFSARRTFRCKRRCTGTMGHLLWLLSPVVTVLFNFCCSPSRSLLGDVQGFMNKHFFLFDPRWLSEKKEP